MNIVIGGHSFTMHRRSEAENWTVYAKDTDDAFGPHLIFQHGIEVLYISPTLEEIRDIHDWCAKILKAEGVEP